MVLSESHSPAYEIIAYHCQQMAEKYLKAMLIEAGLEVPFVHDLLTLNQAGAVAHPGLLRIQKECGMLTPFGTATRYPGSMAVGPEHMGSVIRWAELIRTEARYSLGLQVGAN